MSSSPTPFDESHPPDALETRLDALLRAPTVKPDEAFTDATLKRIHVEAAAGAQEEFDARVEFLLEQSPVRPADDFTAKTLARLQDEAESTPEGEVVEDDKVAGFPKWIIALGSMAAAMVVGMSAFFWLFHGMNPNQQPGGPGSMAQNTDPAPSEGSTVAGQGSEFASDPLLSAQMTDLMVLEEDLLAIAMILDDTDLQGLDTSILQ